MKLLYIANARIPTEKAHGIQIMKMCEAFSARNIDIELVIPWRFNHIQDNPFAYYGVKENFKITKIFSADLVRFGKTGFLIQSFTFAIASFFYCLSHKADIIYSRDELPLFLLSFIKKNIIYEAHTARFNFIIKKFKKIITISKGLKKFYVKNGMSERKIIVAHDGVDMKDFDIKISKRELRKNLQLPENKHIISYVGKYQTMGIRKGVYELIYLLPEILKIDQEAFLLLVGINKDEYEEVYSMFNQLEINDSFYKIMPHIRRKEVPSYLKASDVLVINYPPITHYTHYMSPLKLFEYMASGIPIVSSDLPSIREILNKKNAILVGSDNLLALAGGIKRALEDTAFSATISKQALADVQNYTWDKRVEGILKFITK